MGEPRDVKALTTTFGIISELRTHGELGVTELSERLGRSKASVHHHLVSLEKEGFVSKDGRGRYSVGLQFFSIGIDARETFQIYDAAKNELPKLATKAGETAWCMVEENGRGMFIDGHVAEGRLNPDSVIGTWRPLYNNSAGKAILAHLPENRREEIISQRELEPATENTKTNVAELRAELELTREQGYALNSAEDVIGMKAVGVPIFDSSEHVIGGISLGGAANRLTDDYCVETLVPLVKEAADEIMLSITYD